MKMTKPSDLSVVTTFKISDGHNEICEKCEKCGKPANEYQATIDGELSPITRTLCDACYEIWA